MSWRSSREIVRAVLHERQFATVARSTLWSMTRLSRATKASTSTGPDSPSDALPRAVSERKVAVRCGHHGGDPARQEIDRCRWVVRREAERRWGPAARSSDSQGRGVENDLAEDALAYWLVANSGTFLVVESVGDETRKVTPSPAMTPRAPYFAPTRRLRGFDDPCEEAVDVRISLN